MLIRLITSCALLSLAACTQSQPDAAPVEASASPALLGWSDLTSRPLPQPTTQISYGPLPQHIVDLWLPEGAGPHPVVVMVHGGCWQKAIADRTLMNYAAEDLRQRGLAVWNIEYRGVDETGGGYPGTFTDAAQAADLLTSAATTYDLQTDHVSSFGHSAGGHLVAWLAARANLPEDSPLWTSDPTPFETVVISGGLADLEASEPVTLPSCLSDIMPGLVGETSPERMDVFLETSPARLQPSSARQISVNGTHDRIAPPKLGKAFTELARASGGQAEYVEIPTAGHVELITPGTPAFEAQASILMKAAGK